MKTENVEITDLVEQIKNGGDAGIVTEEAKKLSRKEGKRFYKNAVLGLDREIVVLEELLPNLPFGSEKHDKVLAQIKNLAEARQILTKNHTEVSKAKWATAGTVGATVAVLIFELFKGPIIGTGSKLIRNK